MRVYIFDLDGVVLERSTFADRLRAEYGISPSMTAGFFRGPFVKCQTGEADLKQEILPYLKNWGWTYGAVAFLRFWFECDVFFREGIPERLRLLRQQGHLCCIATNQERYRGEFLREKLQIHTYFDEIFCSYLLGFRKPSPEFFEAIKCALKVDSSSIYFFDDTPENVNAASGCGWNAEIFEGLEQLERHEANS